MAQPIVAVRGFVGSLTINSTAFNLTKWTVKVQSDLMTYATTGQSADSDSNYWKNVLAGLNSATIDIEGYYNHHATAANRWVGSTYNLRPGTGAAGTVACLFTTGGGFSATVVVESIEGGIDAEANRPDSIRATLRVDGAITYTNS